MFFNFHKNDLEINYFLYEIVHHCNLNCKGCDHCAPLAKKELVPVEVFERDILQMKKVFNKIKSIGIMGGEPLLHPQLPQILNLSRKILKNSNILLFSNGILFEQANDTLWESIKDNKIILLITKYTNDSVYDLIEKKSKLYSVNLQYMDGTRLKFKKFNSMKYNLHSDEDINKAHSACYHAEHCHQLENGKLYKCSFICAARHFNQYFGKNLIIEPDDYIDIFKNPKKKDIIDYFNSPIPFCRYCNINARANQIEWGLSQRDISEWT